MIIFSKQKFIITFGTLAILFHIFFFTNTTSMLAYKLNSITASMPAYKLSSIRDIYTRISNFLSLEQTPDQIFRNSQNIIINNKTITPP